MAQELGRIGDLYTILLPDGVSLADDGTQTLSLTGYTSGLLFVKYVTAASAIYSATFSFMTTNSVLACTILDDTTNFDDADTDAKFDLYSDSGTITLKNRTGATVTAYVTGILNK